MKIFVSTSALPPSQYRNYVKGWKPNPVLLKLFEQASNKKGKKAYRVYFDYGADRDIHVNTPVVPHKISEYLKENGIELLDYAAGTAIDKHKRTVRLGKILSRQEELKKLFDNDPARRQVVTASRGKKLVCISMHPYDIAGMSTDRGWTSCMNLNDGVNKKYVAKDVKANTLIAYLVDANDKNINRPISRVLAKSFTDKKKTVQSYGVEYAYPDASDRIFIRAVQSWLDEHINPTLEGTSGTQVLTLDKSLYDDNGGSNKITNLRSLLSLPLKKAVEELDKLYAGMKKKRVDPVIDLSKPSLRSLLTAFPELPYKFDKFEEMFPRTLYEWLDVLKTNPEGNKILAAGLKVIKDQEKTEGDFSDNILRVIEHCLDQSDWSKLAIVFKTIKIQDYINVGYLDDLIAGAYESQDKMQPLRIATNFAEMSLAKSKATNFWRILEGNILEEYSKKSGAKNSIASLLAPRLNTLQSYVTVGNPYVNIESLKSAKKYLSDIFYKLMEILLSHKGTIVPVDLNKLTGESRLGYQLTQNLWEAINKEESKYKLRPDLILNSFSEDSYLVYSGTINIEQALAQVKETCARFFAEADKPQKPKPKKKQESLINFEVELKNGYEAGGKVFLRVDYDGDEEIESLDVTLDDSDADYSVKTLTNVNGKPVVNFFGTPREIYGAVTYLGGEDIYPEELAKLRAMF